MSNSIIFISVSAVLSLVSLILDRKKTIAGFKKGWNMFKNVLIPFLSILVLVSVLLYIIPPSVISRLLGSGSGVLGFVIAAIVGAITLIPGFISYPIAAGLISQGASYAEIGYLGINFTLARTLVSLPLFIGIGYLMERYLKNKHFEVRDGAK